MVENGVISSHRAPAQAATRLRSFLRWVERAADVNTFARASGVAGDVRRRHDAQCHAARVASTLAPGDVPLVS
jgi:hypothetical protein